MNYVSSYYVITTFTNNHSPHWNTHSIEMKIIPALNLVYKILESVEELRIECITKTKLDVREINTNRCCSLSSIQSNLNLFTDYNILIYDDEMSIRMKTKHSLYYIKPLTFINFHLLPELYINI